MDATFDLYKELAWAFVNKENYREYMPLYYANVNSKHYAYSKQPHSHTVEC